MILIFTHSFFFFFRKKSNEIDKSYNKIYFDPKPSDILIDGFNPNRSMIPCESLFMVLLPIFIIDKLMTL